MLARLFRIASSFLAVLAAYWVYVLLAVPWLEPSDGPADTVSFPPFERPGAAPYAELFPPGAWQRDRPRKLETDRGVLLFQEYRPTPDGRLHLRPVTLILRDRAAASRSVVLDAPEGADLTFDAPLDLARASIGRFLGGRLLGDIRIYSPAKEGNDELLITTRNVQLDARRIWTTQNVSFQLGPHYGSGRDLSIDLGSGDNEAEGTLGAVKQLELVHLDKVFLHLPGRGLIGDHDAAEPAGGAEMDVIPLEITSQGPFKFDFQEFTATLSDRVELVRLNLDGPSDHLTCDQLQIVFDLALDSAADRVQSEPEMAGAVDRPLVPLRIKQIVAHGHPVLLQAPSIQAVARAESLRLHLQSRRLWLEDSAHVLLKYQEHAFRSPTMQYEFGADPRRIGRVWAGGPGEFRSTFHQGQDTEPQVVQASWQHELRLDPDRVPNHHVLSLRSQASVQATSMGEFFAGELYLWLREEPESIRASTPRLLPAGAPREPDEPIEPATEFRLEPDRLLALRNVEFDSPQFSGATQRLELWLLNPAPSGTTGAFASGRSPHPPAAPGSAQLLDSGSDQKIDLQSQLIRVRVLKQDDQLHLEHAQMEGDVRLTQLDDQRDGRLPLVVDGVQLELNRQSASLFEAMIQGRPASVSMGGMTLAGQSIHLDQQSNQLWIEGAGTMTLPPPAQAGRGPGRPANVAPSVIRWQEGLNFNGVRARFAGQIELHGQHVLTSGMLVELLAEGTQLDATLTRELDFRAPGTTEPPDLAYVELTSDQGPVTATARSFTGGDQQSLDRMEVRRLTIEKQTGRVTAAGPGWLSTVRSMSEPQGGQMLGQRPGTPAVQQPGQPGASAHRSPQLTFLRVDFQRSIEGNFLHQQARLSDQVRVVSGPVQNWEGTISVDRLQQLREDEKLLRCDEMTVAQFGDSQGEWLELEAIGNTQIEGRNKLGFFTGSAHRLSYTQAKDLLVMEGYGREDALLQRQAALGSPPSTLSARKILFWPKTNAFDFQDVGDINIGDLSNEPRR